MKSEQKVVAIIFSLGLLLVLVAIGTPNLMRSREAANKATRISGLADYSPAPRAVSLKATLETPQDRKEIRNADLALVVNDVRAAAERIRSVTQTYRGEIVNVEIKDSGGSSLSAQLAVRVPSSSLERALADYKKIALHTEHEQVSARDVTREFYDNEAHMRNLRAEEEQYLAIMKQAHTVKDTLDVSEKLSDVRDRIERLQAQIKVMTHDIDMSLINIAVMQEYESGIPGVRWRPLHNARIAARELLIGLGEWVDWIIAVLIKFPLILIWTITVAFILWVFWLIGRLAWFRAVKPMLRKSNPEAS